MSTQPVASERSGEPHRPFALVLAGGGARGFAHVGVLRALEAQGLYPGAIVGVSMGAITAVTYGLRQDWYQALLEVDIREFPGPVRRPAGEKVTLSERLRGMAAYAGALHHVVFGWGIGVPALGAGKTALRTLMRGHTLEETRIPVLVSTTDLLSGERHVLRAGDAAEAAYASAALAGVVPPVAQDGRLLADGVYADIAPIDVARALEFPIVIAVDAGQDLVTADVRTGYQAILRATEICHLRHADQRFAAADFVLRPDFRRSIDTLDFGARRECVAAGARAVRRRRAALADLLASPISPASGLASSETIS